MGKGMNVNSKFLMVVSMAIFVLASCSKAGVDTAAQSRLSPRAAADAFLHRSELLRIKYQFPDRSKQALDDLIAKKYDALETDLGKAETDFERDPSYELAFYDVLHAIAECPSVSPEREAAIKAWVDARPDSVWSHLMLGRYYNFAGCNARGEDWAKDVTDAQWQKMVDFHAKSRAELQKAKQIDPKHLPIYTSLVGLDRADGDADNMKQDYEAGHKLFPTSYNLPVGYMQGLQPRWGGSYEAMDELADSLKTQVGNNPLFWVLQGSAEADQADLASRDDDWRGALAHYQIALRYGDQSPWLIHAAYLEELLRDEGAALQYYRRNELYEMPLSKEIETQEGAVISYCFSNLDKCKTDPQSFPWYGEPQLSDNPPAN